MFIHLAKANQTGNGMVVFRGMSPFHGATLLGGLWYLSALVWLQVQSG